MLNELRDMTLTGLTVFGLAIAAFSGFVLPLPAAAVTLALILAYLDGSETAVYLGRGDRLIGAIAVADQPRETSRKGISALRQSGVQGVVMMTGDRRKVALRIAEALGLRPDEVHSDLLPEEKVFLVGELSGRGKVAYVGDGVNDAGALARADVGIAMGAAGSEVALQAAEVALLSEDMERLAAAHQLARRHHRGDPAEPDVRHRGDGGSGNGRPVLRTAAAAGGRGP